MREISFSTQGSTTYLVLKLDQGEQLDRLAMGMMTNNTIPGLLPISPRRVNRDSYLYYGVSAMTPLHAAYVSLANDKRLLLFLRSFCRLVRECEEYLMDADKLMLEPEFVYVQQSTGEIAVAYLPVEDVSTGITPYRFVKCLLEKVVSNLPQDSKLLPLLYRLTISESQFSVSALDEQLAQLQTSGMMQSDPGSTVRKARQVQQEAPVQAVPATAVVIPAPKPSPEPAAQEIPNREPEEKGSGFMNLFGSSKGSKKPEKPAKSSMGSLFGSSKKNEKVSSAPAFGFAVPGSSPEAPPAAAEPEVPAVEAPFGKVSFPSPFQKKGPQEPVKEPPAPKAEPVSQPVQIPVQQPSVPAQPSGGYTYNLDGMDSGAPIATSLMSDGAASGGSTGIWLVRRSSGQRVPVNHNNFHIGRGRDLVDFFVATATPYIGVDHAYVLIQGSQYYIVDNNSRNHTWLNGQMLEPSKPYPIHPGDTLRMADEYFEVTNH